MKATVTVTTGRRSSDHHLLHMYVQEWAAVTYHESLQSPLNRAITISGADGEMSVSAKDRFSEHSGFLNSVPLGKSPILN